nr:hypothetical protein [Tanacetum cinerariifolium]
MAKSKNEVYDDSHCSKSCRKNIKNLNTKISKLNEELSDNENTLYHYKLGLSHVEARLVEFKTQEIKLCEKIRGLELDVEFKNNKIEYLMNELEQVKKEKEGLDSKLTSFEFASKDLDTLLGSQRTDKNKEGLGYSAVLPSCSSLLSSQERYWLLWHMTGNISYLSEYEPYDEGYVSFGQGGGKITGKVVTDDFSRKGIKREFSNARTPLQNRVAERKNKTLIKAARTMLADVKLPVTFWAEAVNTACYVQNRVLVNKSQNKTPYELFNSRTPVIGFLRPFGCHVMILNTLDHLRKFDAKGDEVVAGTSSTNISGIKDVASQGVKKDASFLRYIALPNWFHEVHMESSNSDAQDACNADVYETSGISNPTATSKIAAADQMESLTVEYVIPTVSLPVPTACLDTSPETSSGSRLISKGVISQEETPSLDNILTLSNRFEDILGDTTNTVDTNGVEADLSNIESIIPASPTPTFRIHKDHTKSQIISPVDTPIQTRHKSKEMGEHSFIATIHQKTNLDLLQFCLFSCFLSQEEPKKIFDALKDPRVRPIGTKWVLKNKKDERGIVIQNKAREFKALMHDKFQMSAMGELTFFLGLQVLQKKDGIFLSQEKYVGDILKKFGYSDVRSANTSMDKENPWGKDGPGKDVELYLYRSMIGSLMYLTASRSDIMFAVCVCARHQVTPKECHLHAVKRIFRYLKGYLKLGLWYPKESPFDLVAYSDSDYGGATQDRKSTTGGC